MLSELKIIRKITKRETVFEQVEKNRWDLLFASALKRKYNVNPIVFFAKNYRSVTNQNFIHFVFFFVIHDDDGEIEITHNKTNVDVTSPKEKKILSKLT